MDFAEVFACGTPNIYFKLIVYLLLFYPGMAAPPSKKSSTLQRISEENYDLEKYIGAGDTKRENPLQKGTTALPLKLENVAQEPILTNQPTVYDNDEDDKVSIKIPATYESEDEESFEETFHRLNLEYFGKHFDSLANIKARSKTRQTRGALDLNYEDPDENGGHKRK